MQTGDTWYLVSRSWWQRWRKACLGEVDKEGGVLESQIGPVDNSNLVDKAGNVTALSLIDGIDIEFVPGAAWTALAKWYVIVDFA